MTTTDRLQDEIFHQIFPDRFAATAIIVALPVAITYIALQKQIVGGLTAGSVKG